MGVLTEQDFKLEPSTLREKGVALFTNETLSWRERWDGLRYLYRAAVGGDGEAQYYLGRLYTDGYIYDGLIPLNEAENVGVKMLASSAYFRCSMGRSYLDEFCQKRYEKAVHYQLIEGPLRDFEGNLIKIHRKGLRLPIEANLYYNGQQNILDLRVKLCFLDADEMENVTQYHHAVIKGIHAWAGDYQVFGGQTVKVQVRIERRSGAFGSLCVFPMTEYMTKTFNGITSVIKNEASTKLKKSLLMDKRSMLVQGFKKWSVTSLKQMYIQSEDGKFDDYYEIMQVAKHEFGHALGLGDLYSNKADSYVGVAPGTYPELDGFHLYDRTYNLVMCDHHGPISNNDIEMVLLAFRDNCRQDYQPIGKVFHISKALGKGN